VTVLSRWIAGVTAAGFAVLAIAVRLGLTDSWDVALRDRARPNDVWGPRQQQADHVVEALRPEVVAPVLAVVVLLLCLVRRSFRPAGFALGLGLLAAALTLGAKIAVNRPDPNGTVHRHVGSFPSGHTATIMVALGIAVFLFRSQARWWHWLLPALAGALMGTCLAIETAHWVTDVLGAGLLATAVLALAQATGADRSVAALDRRPHPADAAGPGRADTSHR
jgi:membrane-associated phospholipid phosphatase